jgi:hypothetical protein
MAEFTPPENWGRCFDVTALTFVTDPDVPAHARLCHAIGIGSAPAVKGKKIKHAWIEFDGMAYDCIWQVAVPAGQYRKRLKVSYVVEYSRSEVWRLWAEHDMPGPWDKRIQEECPDK